MHACFEWQAGRHASSGTHGLNEVWTALHSWVNPLPGDCFIVRPPWSPLIFLRPAGRPAYLPCRLFQSCSTCSSTTSLFLGPPFLAAFTGLLQLHLGKVPCCFSRKRDGAGAFYFSWHTTASGLWRMNVLRVHVVPHTATLKCVPPQQLYTLCSLSCGWWLVLICYERTVLLIG
jgi:hypothetical protein